MRFLWKLYAKLEGWRAVNEFPNHLKKGVILVGPHTTWKDFTIAMAFRSVLHIKHGKYLGKAELFKGPFGFLFKWLGGTPVDRFSKHGVVEQVVEKFNKADNLFIALSPEGTRKRSKDSGRAFITLLKKQRSRSLWLASIIPKRNLVFPILFTQLIMKLPILERSLSFLRH